MTMQEAPDNSSESEIKWVRRSLTLNRFNYPLLLRKEVLECGSQQRH